MSADLVFQIFVVLMAIWAGISMLINASNTKADKAFAAGYERGRAVGRAERSRAE